MVQEEVKVAEGLGAVYVCEWRGKALNEGSPLILLGLAIITHVFL